MGLDNFFGNINDGGGEAEVEEKDTEEEGGVEDPILADDEDEDEELFEDEDKDEDKGEGNDDGRNPKVERRIDKLVGERQEARETALELKGRVDTQAEQIEGLEALTADFNKLYGRFDDPPAQLKFDSHFLQGIEEAVGSDANLATLIKPIFEKANEASVSQKPAERDDAQDDDAPENRTMSRIAQREASSVIDSALPEGVRGSFATMLKNNIYDALDADDLLDLEPDDVLFAAKEFAKANGFKRDDIYNTPGKPVTKDGPPTGGKANAAPAGKKTAAKADSKEADDKPKTPHEWRLRNIKRLEKLIGE